MNGNKILSESEDIEMESVPYRELVGSLIYLSNTSRPGITFAAGSLSRFNANPTKHHWQIEKYVLRYLKITPTVGIIYRRTGEQILIIMFTWMQIGLAISKVANYIRGIP